MSEVNFSSRRDAEDPLYLDFVAARPQGRQRSARPSGAPDDPDRPLHLDPATREPRRGKGAAGLIFAGLAALLLAAVAAALYLPSVLHPRQAEPTPAPTAASPAPTPAAPATADLTPPAQPQPQAPVAQAAAPSAAPAETAAVPPPPEAPAARHAVASHAHARAHAHAKPRVAESKPRPSHAAAAKRPPASHEKSAHARRAHGGGVDLDALAKSLQ